MAWIKTVDEDDAEGRLAKLYAACADPESGNVDNVLKIHSLHPAGMQGHLEVYRAAMRDTPGLPGAEREMIAIVVSLANECAY